MMSRTTPAGIFVIALAALFAVGCNAQTSSVFFTLVDPAAAPASSSDTDTSVSATAESGSVGTWWPHPDGYQMDLPPGWLGAPVDQTQTNLLVTAIGTSYPELSDRMRLVLSDSGSRVSAVAGDPTAADTGPVMLVIAQPKDGRRPHEIKQHVKKQIAQLPGITATPILQDAGLDAMRGGWRFDYSLADPDIGTVRVRSYLLRWGEEAYLVNFVAPEASADEADALFDAIAASLKFGV
jgi:hypothetical protein